MSIVVLRGVYGLLLNVGLRSLASLEQLGRMIASSTSSVMFLPAKWRWVWSDLDTRFNADVVSFLPLSGAHWRGALGALALACTSE